MSFWLRNTIKRFDRISLAAILTGVVGFMGLVPLQASALTPPSGSLQLVGTNVCAQVSGYTSGSAVTATDCQPLQINQKWYVNRAGYDPQGNIAYTLENAKAGAYQCINSTGAGLAVNTAACNGIKASERFVYVNSQNGGNELRNIATGQCLDAGSVLGGGPVVLAACDANSASQLWYLGPNTADPFSS